MVLESIQGDRNARIKRKLLLVNGAVLNAYLESVYETVFDGRVGV